MQISYKHQATERTNGDACVVIKPCIEDETMDFVIVEITGRYPSANQATNLKCKEIIYVNAGSGKVVIEGKAYLINAGDVILIEAAEKFYWEGNMNLSISCRPAWTQEQHVLID